MFKYYSIVLKVLYWSGIGSGAHMHSSTPVILNLRPESTEFRDHQDLFSFPDEEKMKIKISLLYLFVR